MPGGLRMGIGDGDMKLAPNNRLKLTAHLAKILSARSLA
jgi:hypothetical protein